MITALLILASILWIAELIDLIVTNKSRAGIVGAILAILFWKVSLATAIVVIVVTVVVCTLAALLNSK
jgi:hypothetical protein